MHPQSEQEKREWREKCDHVYTLDPCFRLRCTFCGAKPSK
jgi:hypothetical protein